MFYNTVMNSKKINYVLIVIWLFIVVFTMFHHEIWRDEARVWWFVRDLNYKELFNSIRGDGHPYLWYLVLLPFAKSGFSPFVMQIMAVISVFFSVCIFCFKSEFNLLIKLLFIFSSGMLYFMPVIARNYALIPLILFAIALIYPKRNKSPFLYTAGIILLSQTHMLMWGACFILSILFIIEQIKNKEKYAMVTFLIFIIYAIVSAYIYLPVIFLKGAFFHSHIAKNVLSPVHLSIFSDMKNLIMNMLICPKVYKYIYISSALLLIGIILKINYKAFLIFLFSTGFMLYVFVHIWFEGVPYQKFFLITLILVFCSMILHSKSKFDNIMLQISLSIFLAVSFYVFNPVKLIEQEIKYKFTNTKEIADFYNKNIKSNKKIFLVDISYVLDDTWKVFLHSIDGVNYKPKDDYVQKINEEIQKRPFAQYLIVNSKYRKFINQTNYIPVIKINYRDRVSVYGFNAEEYYYLYKIRS